MAVIVTGLRGAFRPQLKALAVRRSSECLDQVISVRFPKFKMTITLRHSMKQCETERRETSVTVQTSL